MKRLVWGMLLNSFLAFAMLVAGPASTYANSPSDIVASATVALEDIGKSDLAGSDYVAAEDLTASGVSMGEADHLFESMAHQPDIAFRYVPDGCYARAQLMILRMQKKGVQSVRVWSFPAAGGALRVKTNLVSKGYVEWGYHVAPAIPVNKNGKTTYLVIDPSLFRGPVPVSQWRAVQKNTHTGAETLIRMTKNGVAPVLPNGRRAQGTGYWPSNDPPEGRTPHAVRTMRRYLALSPSGSY